jgi:lipid-A-disaccharide synthase
VLEDVAGLTGLPPRGTPELTERTLETALFKRPMVISYAVSPWVRRVMAWKSGQQRPYVPWVGLPNVLLNDSVVPELIQEDATPEKLAQAVYEKFIDERKAREIEARFHGLHHSLRCDTASRAADVILELAHRSRLTTKGLGHTGQVTP